MPDQRDRPQSSAKTRSSRIPPILGSALFLLLAPGIIAGRIPWLISRWQMQPPLLGLHRFAQLEAC